MKPSVYLWLIICFFLAAGMGFAQDDQNENTGSDTGEEIIDEADELDELFAAPADDIVVEEEKAEEVDHRKDFEESEKISVRGNFKAIGLIGAGWTNWDFLSDITQDFDGYACLSSTATITFDARPTADFRVYGECYAAYNPVADDTDIEDIEEVLNYLSIQEGSWDGPKIKELYCDYILADFLYARLGKHDIGWGQGRLFTPGDILSDSINSFNFRFSIPTLSGLVIVVLTNNGTSYKDLVYAGKADFVLGDTLISPALRYNYDEGFTGLLSLKQVLFSTDFLVDIKATYYDSFSSVYALAGFFREWETFQLYGEYLFSWTAGDTYTHDAALAAKWDNPFGAPFDLAAKCEHNFMDSSGTITLGLSQGIWHYVTMNLGLPIVYGADGTSAVENSTRRIAFIFGLKLSGGF